MIPIDVGFAFVLAALVLAIAPGPDNIFVLTQSALYGAKAGIVTTLGLITGLVGHTLAVAFGVAAIFTTSPMAYTVLKCVGAAYLVYLAYLTFRSGSSVAALQKQVFVGYGALYRRGIIMNITNPKVTLFFLALLPQFANPARGSLPLQISVLGLLFMASALVVFSLVAILGGRLALWFNSAPKYQILMNRMAAIVFLGMALALVIG